MKNVPLSAEPFISYRHIRSRKRQTILSVGAVALAVAISLTSISLENGFQEMLFDIIVEDLPHVSVSPNEGEDYIHLYHNLMEIIRESGGVTVVSPALTASATLSYKDNVESGVLYGINPAEMSQIFKSIADGMVVGDLMSIEGGRRIVMDKKLAEKLKVKYGQSVVASFPDSKTMNLVVAGIYSAPEGFPEGMTFVSLPTAREYLGDGDVVTAVNVKLQDVYAADALAAKLNAMGYNAESWQQLYPEIIRTMAIEGVQNNIIMLLIMIIASFGIASVMYMLVLEKTPDIGMLMAMGADSGTIRRIFLIESGILGLLGGAAGMAVGLILSLYLKSLKLEMQSPGGQMISLPVVISYRDIIAIVLLAVILSMAAGLYPAVKASKLDPVEALKG